MTAAGTDRPRDLSVVNGKFHHSVLDSGGRAFGHPRAERRGPIRAPLPRSPLVEAAGATPGGGSGPLFPPPPWEGRRLPGQDLDEATARRPEDLEEILDVHRVETVGGSPAPPAAHPTGGHVPRVRADVVRGHPEATGEHAKPSLVVEDQGPLEE